MRRYAAPPMMDVIRRGSTPTLMLRTPYSAEIIVGGYITISQRGSVVLEKEFSDPSVRVLPTIEDDTLVEVDLTQEETLMLTTVDFAKVQMRFKLEAEKTAASGVFEYQVLDILKGGEI